MFVKRVLTGLFVIVALGVSLMLTAQPANALSSTSSALYPITDNDVSAIVAAPDGSTYVGGSFVTVGSTPRNRLVHILSDGTTVDPVFDPDFNGSVNSLVLDSATNTLYVGGGFTVVNGGTVRNGLAAINATTGIATAFDPNVAGSIDSLAIDTSSNIIYAGGNIVNVNGGTVRTNLAAFNGLTGVATAFDPNVDGSVFALKYDSGASILYAGGQFTTVNGATPRNNLAAFNTAAVATAFDPDISGTVRALDLDVGASTLYAGGAFNTVNGGTVRNNVVALSTTTAVATAFDPNIASGWCLSSAVSSIVLSPTTNTLYVVGCYGDVNAGTPRDSVAEFGLATSVATVFAPAPALGPLGSGGGVFAVAINLTDTSLYVGGKYTDNVGFTEVNLKCFGSCITAPPVPPTPPVPAPLATVETLAPTGDNRVALYYLATSLFVLGSACLGYFVFKKEA